MTDDTAHRETVAAILAAGILSGVAKSSTASRAVAVYHDVLAALTPSSSASVIEQTAPPTPRRGEPPRVSWIPGASLDGKTE